MFWGLGFQDLGVSSSKRVPEEGFSYFGSKMDSPSHVCKLAHPRKDFVCSLEFGDLGLPCRN